MSNRKINEVGSAAIVASLIFTTPCIAATGAAAPDWKISSKTSALDGTTRYSALLDSVGSVPNSIGRPETVTLVVRCVPGSGLASYIAWPLFMGSHDLQVIYRFDQEPVQHAPWGISEDGRASGYFEASPALAGFLNRLSAAKRLVVQAPPYESLPIEAEFELGNVAEVIASARKACA